MLTCIGAKVIPACMDTDHGSWSALHVRTLTLSELAGNLEQGLTRESPHSGVWSVSMRVLSRTWSGAVRLPAL